MRSQAMPAAASRRQGPKAVECCHRMMRCDDVSTRLAPSSTARMADEPLHEVLRSRLAEAEGAVGALRALCKQPQVREALEVRAPADAPRIACSRAGRACAWRACAPR